MFLSLFGGSVGSLGVLSSSPSPRVPQRLPRHRGGGWDTQEPAAPGTALGAGWSLGRARRPLPSRRNASDPVGRSWQEGDPNRDPRAGRYDCRSPPAPSRGGRLGKLLGPIAAAPDPRGAFQVPAADSAGEVGQASPGMTPRPRGAARPPLLPGPPCTIQPLTAEVGHAAARRRHGCHPAAPKGAEGRAAGKQSGTPQEEEERPGGRAEPLKPPRSSAGSLPAPTPAEEPRYSSPSQPEAPQELRRGGVWRTGSRHPLLPR